MGRRILALAAVCLSSLLPTTAQQARPGSNVRVQGTPAEAQTATIVPPNAPSRQAVPLSKAGKLGLFARDSYSPLTFAEAALNATWWQAMGDMRSYGGGAEGWGKRYGISMTGAEIRAFSKDFMFPALLGQDPRYFRKGDGRFVSRVLYSASRTVVGRKDDGTRVFNGSGVLSIVFCKMLTDAYYPASEHGVARTASSIGTAFGTDALGSLFNEFWPDVARKLRRQKRPAVDTPPR